MWTSILRPTASTMPGSAEMEEGAPSSCRPPWFETMMASAPLSTAICASSASWMPLRISLPPQRFLIHSTSFHDSAGSNCLAVHSDSEPMFSTPLTWPTMLPNWRRGRAQHAQAPARLGHHVQHVGDRQLGRSRQAVPQVLVALADDLQVQREHQRGAVRRLRAVDQAFDEIAVAHHVQLEPERVVVRAPGHVLDRADAHGGQREGDAELLRRTGGEDFAVGMLHAGQARGRDGHRHGDVLADHLRAGGAVFHVHRDALAQQDAFEIRFVGAIGAFGPRAGVGIVVEHARHALFREYAQVFDVGDHGHGLSPAVARNASGFAGRPG